MSISLKKKQLDGTPYERPPEVEACIAHLENLDLPQRFKHIGGVGSNRTGYVSSEALVYFLRLAWAEGDKGTFERIFRELLNRVEHSLHSALPDARLANAVEVRDAVRGRFLELITRDCLQPSGRLDFFEIRFAMALAALRTSALRRHGPKKEVTTESLEHHDEHGSPDFSKEVEEAAAEFFSLESSKLDDPAFRFALYAAIDKLPDDQKQVIQLLLQGIPIDSKDEDVSTIAKILNCDERTVRNRRDRAHKKLAAMLAKELS